MATSKDKSEALSESVRPKRQVRLPTYLSDYQVDITGHRELTSSHAGNIAAQTTFRLQEECSTESDGMVRRMPSAGPASTMPESQYAARDEWGEFYTDLEEIQAQLGQDTQLIRSLRDRVRQLVLSECCGTLEEISHTDTCSLLQNVRVSSPAARQALSNPAHISSPVSFSALPEVSPLQSQMSVVSSDKYHSVTHSKIQSTVEVNPPPQEDELWPEPPPPVCEDLPYRARVKRAFPVGYVTSISLSHPVQLAARKSVAQPLYRQEAPVLVNSVQNPSSMPPRGDIRANPMPQGPQDQASLPYYLRSPPTQAPYSFPYSAPWAAVPPPPQEQPVYGPRSGQWTEPWLKYPEMLYSQPHPPHHETVPTLLPAQEKEWPKAPAGPGEEDPTELRRSLFCHFISACSGSSVPEASQYATWNELVEATTRTLQRESAGKADQSMARLYQQAVSLLTKQSQLERFPEEYHLLKANKPIPSSSRLLVLCPEFDATDEVIRVGGRLRRADDLDPNFKHPIVLDPSHGITKLLIQDFDQRLCHPGPERVFAELRRSYWVLRGREAVRRHQRTCLECRQLRSKPVVPKMADLPPARLPAPHFGGAWEREIRSVKAALSTTIGAQSVPEEVLRTVLIEVEAILNSKPLGYVSANISDMDPITPNHLLMGRPNSSLPQVVYHDSESLSRRRWRQSQILADHFWAKFIRYYLPSLQLRQKWQVTTADLTEGSCVMMVDPQLPRTLWLVGKVERVFPSTDGHVRVAEVKVNGKSFTRPVAKLITLPKLPDEN
ncbi:hypothetical protein QQF64_032988 [Cirrhinus molitorella]|uniref:DUF5641 domain-containing protein n=1 Tax=Cirrhinus molitorella TaxID=172907 RepID=A0ABR3MST2_9TELE